METINEETVIQNDVDFTEIVTFAEARYQAYEWMQGFRKKWDNVSEKDINILSNHKFTNPNHELDRGSKDLYAYMDTLKSQEHQILYMALYRSLISHSTAEVIFNALEVHNFELTEDCIYGLRSLWDSGMVKKYGNGYTGSKGMILSNKRKLTIDLREIYGDSHFIVWIHAILVGVNVNLHLKDLDNIPPYEIRDKFIIEPEITKKGVSIEDLETYEKGYLPFVYYEMVCDIEYYYRNKRSSPVSVEMVNHGIGALRGIEWLTGNKKPTDEEVHNILAELSKALWYNVCVENDRNVRDNTIFTYRLAEQWLCEFDKYNRVQENPKSNRKKRVFE